MQLQASWIWRKQRNLNPYNQTIIARRTFMVETVQQAVIAITADSYFRLYVNGTWVADGPCRSWPEHYQYDLIDVTPFLKEGQNQVQIVARYYGVGTFHQVPRKAGLLAELTITPTKGRDVVLGTDESWQVAEAPSWRQETPKISIQMEPFEHYDARRDKLSFSKAAVICSADEGPWRDLHPRDCALLNRRPAAITNYLGAQYVTTPGKAFCLPLTRLIHPGLIEANHYTGQAAVVATVIVAPEDQEAHITSPHLDIRVNGQAGARDRYTLQRGRNFLLGATRDAFSHQSKDVEVRLHNPEQLRLVNPLTGRKDAPWSFAPFEEATIVDSDIHIPSQPSREKKAVCEQVAAKARRALAEVTTVRAYKSMFRSAARVIPSERVMEDPHSDFINRCVVGDATESVTHPNALIHDNAETTVVVPSENGLVELAYDLADQRCGYYAFELVAEAGTIVDVFGIEYIAPSGALQHTAGNRNGLRYICKTGTNRFVSLKRRSGRFLYLTLRNHKKPVQIRHFQLIESGYPVERVGRFACSDPALDRLWTACARTLELCMEDTFTDCPLYEQTLWVGDMRNEALFAYEAFGAEELAKRCLTLTGQSLDRYPLVGCQVPSCWDCLLPAWSFLWSIAVWEYYFRTGDKAYLAEAWPWVMENLRNASRMSDDRGLFSAPTWNLFDWAPQDIDHRTVTHNSLFIIGALDAALNCAKVVGSKTDRAWLTSYRNDLQTAVAGLWVSEKEAYADSIHNDGTISAVTSQHTSFLALLYDAAPPEHRDAALRNTLEPPEGMVRVGSPFAEMFLLEALEKEGRYAALLERIRTSFLPMLDTGATTVWETFTGALDPSSEFPTRSHCHAWSSAPLYFLNRLVLGIRQRTVGGKAYDISPVLDGLTWAQGVSAGFLGPIEASWRLEEATLYIDASSPKGVSLRYVPNETHAGLKVMFNGKPVA